MEYSTDNPKLVIVIPTKNRHVLLERALESVRTQTYDAYRMVIINDGSTDDTRTYLEALSDPRIQVIHHEKSGGVNAARNAAFRTLREGEWAVQLDDDDMLLPNALGVIAEAIKEAPSNIQIICFNTVTRTPEGESKTGYQFKQGETKAEPTYENFMLGVPTNGDARMVAKWTLFPMYLFPEDINGFEGEWILRVSRDGVGIRYVPGETMFIDQTHGGEHLSTVAARRNPESFVRAYRRIFHTHSHFFKTHPQQSMPSAMSAMKLSVRAFDIPSGLYFSVIYVQDLFQIWFGTKRSKEKPY